jgi:phosphoribosylformylglycinamidine cyclo-ligase
MDTGLATTTQPAERQRVTAPGETGPDPGRVDPYRAAGVDYSILDEGKRDALAEALTTSPLLAAHGARAIDESRGSSAFLFELGRRTLALVVEGLGTKSMIARQVYARTGSNHFGDVAYDTVAAIVNDLCSVGALPLVVNAYFATGASQWYRESERTEALLEGWRRACVDADCAWGGGESPSLPGLVDEGEIELAGAAVGVVPEGRTPILGESLKAGDEIVLVASSGLHANGASLARLLAGQLPDGYATALPSGVTLGAALLEPSLLYVPLMSALVRAGHELSYVSHVTGHGLLKLMRPAKSLTYRIESLPEVPEVLSFLVTQAGMDAHAAYSTFNMGSGYALYCPAGRGEAVVRIAEGLGLRALLAGHVEDGPRQVILEPVGVHFASEELHLSADTDPPIQAEGSPRETP